MSGFQNVISLGGGRLRHPRTEWRSVVARVGIVFGRLMEARRTRLMLASLDDHELKDLGISRAQAEFEASRPFRSVRDAVR